MIFHKILVTKLTHFSFQSIFLELIKSYLGSNSSRVVIVGISAKLFMASSAAPQCIISGALFFILFINDIASCFSATIFLLYADVLQIYSEVSCINVEIIASEGCVEIP